MSLMCMAHQLGRARKTFARNCYFYGIFLRVAGLFAVILILLEPRMNVEVDCGTIAYVQRSYSGTRAFEFAYG